MAVDVIIFRGTADVLFQIHEHALTVPAGNVVVDVQLERKAGVLFDRPFAGTRDKALIGVKADGGTGAVAEGSDGMRVEHRLDALCLGLTHGRGKDGVSLLSDVHVLHDDLTEAVAAVQKRLQILRDLLFTFTQNVSYPLHIGVQLHILAVDADVAVNEISRLDRHIKHSRHAAAAPLQVHVRTEPVAVAKPVDDAAHAPLDVRGRRLARNHEVRTESIKQNTA